MSRISFQPVGGYAVVVAVCAALLLLAWVVRPSFAGTTRLRRSVLVGLRCTIFVLAVLAMLRPSLIVTEVKQQSASLVVLLDGSRSMIVTDSFGGKSRWEALRGLVQSATPQIKRLAERLQVKLYAFDAEPHPLGFDAQSAAAGPIPLDRMPQGQETALGWALEEAIRREAGSRLAGVILLSDGAQRAYAPRDTPPQAAARRLADLGCPLYTLVFGEARGLGQARDVALHDFLASQTVYAKNELNVRGTLRIDGLAGKPVVVQLLFETAPGKMEVVASTEVTAVADGQQLPIELNYIPQLPGEHKLTFRAVPVEGELVRTNNEISTYVTVLKGGINILYLEGDLRREQRFIRAALDASPDIKLDFWIDRQPRSKRPTDIGDRFQPGTYDVHVVGDLDAAVLAPSAWKDLADRVEAGAGLMMLGGFHSFGPGGYSATALADVLPIRMDRLERQPPDESIREDLHLPGPLKMRPAAPLGIRDRALQLAPEGDNLRLWKSLPPLEGANKFVGLKRGAAVLLETDDSQASPLLVSGNWGNGRVLAFAGDSTWHWPLEGFEKEHKRFWRQLVLWLAKKDLATEGRVWIQLDPRRYRPGSRVDCVVGATSPEGEPVPDAKFEAEIVLPDGKRRPLRIVERGSEHIGSFFDTLAAGDYAIDLTARTSQGTLGTARARFLVFEQDLELDHPAADPGLLASLARTTSEFGGQALAPEEFSDLLNRIYETPLQLEVETQIKKTYWDTWPFLICFIALMSAEWYLRKRWNLV